MKGKAIADLPILRKRLVKIETNRIARLKSAKQERDLRRMIENSTNKEINPRVLTERQRMAIHLMTDFVHNYTNDWIIKRLGIQAGEFYRWRNDPLFLRELDKEITRRRTFIRIHAFRNVHRAILRGDMKATWNYLKMSGDLKENIEVTDRTGERELSEAELEAEIGRLTKELAAGPVPSSN